jgi:hypothetical protein
MFTLTAPNHDTLENMDIETGLISPSYLTGYPSLANFVSSDRDQTSAIFKRFGRLAARNLLHLQSELAELQAKQDDLDELERCGDMPSKQYSRNWPEFCQAALVNDRQRQRKDVAEAIKVAMKEYSEYVPYDRELANAQK